MTVGSLPADFPMSISSGCLLATEVWRLAKYVESAENADETISLRYTVRQLSRLVDELGFAILDLKGRPYDHGMIQEVVDVIEDTGLSEGQQMIDATISPTVTWKQVIAQPGQITIRRAPSLD